MNGIEQPAGADLLDIARRTLLENIAPDLAGDARFQALMVANAMALAVRELRADPAEITATLGELGDLAALCGDIRAGRCDPGAADHARIAALLRRLAEARCRISAPKALDA